MPPPIKPLSAPLNLALIQLSAGSDKALNLKHFTNHIVKAIKESPKKLDLVVLPECFNSPYAVDQFRKYSEPIPEGETTLALSKLAKEHQIYLVGGLIPEIADNKIYNTSVVFGPGGEILAKHRKAHLFDIDIKGGITFKELISLTAGDKATVFKLGDFGYVGLGICYDIRFPELAQIAARKNAFAMIYPGAFNTTTGPLHWHLLARARAVDNQVYSILCSPARDPGSGYQAYGHSLVSDPAGHIISEAGEGEEIVYASLDPEALAKVRSGIPVGSQRRFDLYEDVAEKAVVGDK